MREKTEGENIKYKCKWCSFEFERYVVHGGPGRKKGVISTQVKCPNCLNYIETWKREETDNLIRKKHIHLR